MRFWPRPNATFRCRSHSIQAGGWCLSQRTVAIPSATPCWAFARAIQVLHQRFSDVEFLWPVHPNPSVKPVVISLMSSWSRVRLCEPLAYGEFVTAMKRAVLILTDSGGVQEEAPALGKPVLVLRDESERPEAIESGVAKLVGRDAGVIVDETSRLLEDADAYRMMARGISPYGDGLAARRIVALVRDYLGVASVRKPALQEDRLTG